MTIACEQVREAFKIHRRKHPNVTHLYGCFQDGYQAAMAVAEPSPGISEAVHGPRCQTCGGSGSVDVLAYRDSQGEEWEWPPDKASPDVPCPECEGSDGE